MARQNLNTGVTPNDGLGDTLRNGAQKINENFVEVYTNVTNLRSDLTVAQVQIVDIANTITTLATTSYVDAEIAQVSNTISNLIDNDNQSLSFTNGQLSISGGNSVNLNSLTPDLTPYATLNDLNAGLAATSNSILNEVEPGLQPQTLVFDSNTSVLTISGGNFVDLSSLAGGTSNTSNTSTFDQSLNTTDGPTFSSLTISPLTGEDNVDIGGTNLLNVSGVENANNDLNLTSGESVNINTGTGLGGDNCTFEFMNDGTFYMPKNIVSNTSFISTPRNDNDASLMLIGAIDVTIRANEGGSGGPLKEWRFTSDGEIEFPDGSIQNTAATGIGGGNYGDADVNLLLNTATATENQFLSYAEGSYFWSSSTSSYNNTSVDNHLNTGSATGGQMLTWSGSDYQWANAATGSSYTNDDVDTHLNLNGALPGQFLSYNGADYQWANAAGGEVDLTGYLKPDGNGDIQITGTMTADAFVSTQTGTPIIYSATEVVVQAQRLRVDSAPLNHGNLTTAERDLLVALNGDMIYNTTVHKFQGYANGIWVDLH